MFGSPAVDKYQININTISESTVTTLKLCVVYVSTVTLIGGYVPSILPVGQI